MNSGPSHPCECASGKAYEDCCGKQKQELGADSDFREVEAQLMERMLSFADEHFGEVSIEQAWTLFLDEATEFSFDPEDPLNLLFIPWYLYNWTLESPDDQLNKSAPLNTTVAEAFMKAKTTLTASEKSLIEASNRCPLSFYEIKHSVPGVSIQLKDLLRGDLVQIDEDSASQTLKVGEIILASLMRPYLGKLRALSVGPFALPLKYRDQISELAEEMAESVGKTALDEAALHQQEAFSIGLYLDLLEEVLEESEED